MYLKPCFRCKVWQSIHSSKGTVINCNEAANTPTQQHIINSIPLFNVIPFSYTAPQSHTSPHLALVFDAKNKILKKTCGSSKQFVNRKQLNTHLWKFGLTFAPLFTMASSDLWVRFVLKRDLQKPHFSKNILII